MWVRPLLVARLANCVPAVAIALFVAAMGVEVGGAVGAIVVGIAVIVAIYLWPRAFRMGVYCDGNTATVHGQFRDRRIRRDQVIDVVGTGTIKWRDDAGQQRRSFVVVLNGGHRALPPITRHNHDAVNKLRHWAGLKRFPRNSPHW